MAARMFTVTLLALSLCLGHLDVQAQAPSHDPKAYFPSLAAAERALAHLPLAGPSQPPTRDEDADLQRRGRELQKLATERAFVGDTDGAIAAFDLQRAPSMPISAADTIRPGEMENVATLDAIQAIVAQARTKQAVILNEAHHVPMHRAFAQRLAGELRKIGYTYLACETFNESAPGEPSPAAPGQAILRTGTYTRDPVFASFVNAALKDGWTLIAYEHRIQQKPGADFLQQIREREHGQARNLVDRIFAKDKNAKVFVYAGYSHVHKARPNDPIVWMGEYLRQLVGHNVLHVDQTSFYAHPNRQAEEPLYAGLVDRFPSKLPFVLRASDGSYPILAGLQGNVDLQVIFPRYASQHGRPDWLRTLAGRNPRSIPAGMLPKSGRRLIKAFRVGDREDAIPTDVVLVEAGKPAPALMLPSGDFRYAYEDEDI